MTTHHLDLHVRSDPETAPYQIMGALYGRLHLALVQQGSGNIGVSFPAHDDARPTLGTLFRLHGSEESLRALMSTAWLRGLSDHLHVSPIAAAPVTALHRTVSRVQAKSSAERLRRRAMKRHGLDATAASERIPVAAEERLQLPFVTLGSRSTKQPSFPLFIRHGKLVEMAVPGSFNSYGLSHVATIPWF